MQLRLLSISAGLLTTSLLLATTTPKPIRPVQPPVAQPNDCCGDPVPLCPPDDPNCKL